MPRILTPAIYLLSAIAVSLLVTPAEAQHTKDSLETVRKRLDDKTAVLLDVREQQEWDAGHLSDATLVPLSKLRAGIDPKQLAKKIPKGKTVYCHCRSGGRVLPASEILRQMGYDARPLKSGYRSLLEAGFPKAKSANAADK